MGNGSKNYNILKEFILNENGQGMVEYGVIIVLVFLVALPAVTLTARAIHELYEKYVSPLVFA